MARGDSIGDAWIDVHANTDKFPRELEHDLDHIADDADAALQRTGKDFGDKITDSTSSQIRRRGGKEFGRAVEDATRRTRVSFLGLFGFTGLRNAFRRRFRRDVGRSITEEIGDAIDRAASSGGIFNKLTTAVSDAVGAGFNVSGKSPLIALLIPVFLALGGVIAAALQAVNALVALLVTLPTLLASIGAQVGVLVIAFHGMGTAIQGAFAAKNAKELNEAIKNLTPSAQAFVKSLLPLRDLFRTIQRVVQENFFKALGPIIPMLQKALGPTLIHGFATVATAMGKLFNQLAKFFASPTFVTFVKTVFPATTRWLQRFGPALVDLLTGMINMANAALPFLLDVGNQVAGFLTLLGLEWSRFARDPAFKQWLADMSETVTALFGLLSGAFQFLMAFLDQLNKAGGNQVIDKLTEALQMLAGFLETETGQQAMRGLVNLVIFGIESFTGLLIAILAVVAALQAFFTWFSGSFGPGVIRVFRAIGDTFAGIVGFVQVWVARILIWLDKWFVKGRDILSFFRSIPGRLLDAFRGAGTLLLNAGRNLIEGLMNGIRQKFQPLTNLIHSIVNVIGRFLPGSPAKEGPLAGSGYSLLRGQRMMQDFIKGIEMETPNLRNATTNATSNIVFGRDSIQMTFQGPIPDQSQARTVGSAMGLSAANIIATRNTRLAVRSL
ncbi:MAG TPA: hypothetical protein VIV15_09980 [Anaerolineales bacterium]